jgi:hypothetical protein
MGARTQVPADLPANIFRQFIVDERRQFAKNLETSSCIMLTGRTFGTPSSHCDGTFGHGASSLY